MIDARPRLTRPGAGPKGPAQTRLNHLELSILSSTPVRMFREAPDAVKAVVSGT